MTSEISRPKAHFLRLVETPYKPERVSSATFVRPAWQSTFFATENPHLLVFVNFEKISESDFVNTLEGARPKILIDLRRVPRFDLDSLNRRRVFAIFTSVGIQYVDLSGRLKSTGQFPGQLAPNAIAEVLLELLGSRIEGPLAFVVEAQQFDETYITELIDAFPSKQDHPWDILLLPFSDHAAALLQSERSLVFVSHANPEDNGFATWLAGQLALAGYSVWSDVMKLVGGETIWDDIEQTIRYRAAKVIAVLSRHSQNKPGVLDEIDLAVRVERASGLERFLLPIRLDDMPYADIRANIARKMVIDFRDNWALGLHKLLSVLERDRVVRKPSSNADALAGWVRDRIAQRSGLILGPQELISNWLPIQQLPSAVFMHDISAPSEHIDSLIRTFRSPCFRYLRLIGSFANSEDFQHDLPSEIRIAEKYRISTDEFLLGTPNELPGMQRWEAQKFIINLLRQSWNLKMKNRGLLSFETASGQLAWYMPKGFSDSNRVDFLDAAGKKRRKSLVGWSERRQVYWHFAVEARPVLGHSPHFLLKQHVIFTPDGIAPIESKERMHLLRRRFCKSWWNDRWRDLLIAYIHWLGEDKSLTLEVGANASVSLSESLMTIQSPVSVLADRPLPILPYDEEDELDADDGEEEDDPFDDSSDDRTETAES